MKSSGLKGNFRKIIVIFSIVLLVSVVFTYLFLSDFPYESKNALSVKDVIFNSEEYLGENITVEGYFLDHFGSEQNGYISPIIEERPIEQGDLEEKVLLLIDHSKIDTILDEETKYYFSGMLTELNNVDFPTNQVIMIVDKVDEV